MRFISGFLVRAWHLEFFLFPPPLCVQLFNEAFSTVRAYSPVVPRFGVFGDENSPLPYFGDGEMAVDCPLLYVPRAAHRQVTSSCFLGGFLFWHGFAIIGPSLGDALDSLQSPPAAELPESFNSLSVKRPLKVCRERVPVDHRLRCVGIGVPLVKRLSKSLAFSCSFAS